MSDPSASEPPQGLRGDGAEAELAPGHLFPIVGIGASAGGLEALTELLQAMSPRPGLAFVVALHLDPRQKSLLPELIAKTTPMTVREVAEGMAVEVNHVYLIPPAADMALRDGRLFLTPRAVMPGGPMPIDHLFRSLALVQRSRAVGVVLSGGGSDGSLGLQAIKGEGGITIAQDEKTARHASMPRAAVNNGSVDYVLRPREIAGELERIARHPYTREAQPDGEAAPAGEAFAGILALLRSHVGVDFSNYKQSTIRRRVLRRMALRGLEDVHEYRELLHKDAGEVQQLYQDFLIRVTQFFRNPEAFAALKEKVLPPLLHNRPAGQPLRVWVAGCATGEEVYSLAMVLLEYLDGRAEAPPIKLLATDLNEAALDRARAGLYLDNIEIDVAPERLRRLFLRRDGHYQISKAVRELCVFSRHNMVADPPFSHLDLISCRNVLIYLEGVLQKRLLPVLHYALNPEGFLLLGSSESVGAFNELFVAVDARNRIFAKRPVGGVLPLELGAGGAAGWPAPRAGREEAPPSWSALDVQREADRILLARYAPVGVVVDESTTVLQFRGRTSAFLEPAPGLATLDLFRMLREGLMAEVRAALNQARAENDAVVRTGLRLIDGSEVRLVRVDVIPFRVPSSGVRFFLVLFQDMLSAEAPPPAYSAVAPAAEQQVPQLQQELTSLREYLQSVIEEQESTNEELKSANEEILSANEELQSTNEELQTANEEAQSANEELATVNEELRYRNAELARANNDLVNLLSGVGIPIVLVGRDLRIRRFTPPAEKAFNLISTDVGRPISDIKPNLNVADLGRLIAGVIDTLTPHQGEVRDDAGHGYALSVRPYVTLDNKIDGASVVLIDLESIQGK